MAEKTCIVPRGFPNKKIPKTTVNRMTEFFYNKLA